jgi:hypothetical protein
MDRASEAHRSAAICALIGVVGTAIGTVGYWPVSTIAVRLVQALGLLITGTALSILQTRRQPYSRALANALFLIVLLPTVAMIWMVDDAVAAHSNYWVPFEPSKLSVLTLAMIAPPGWATGLVGILLFVGSSLLHQLFFPSVLRAHEATSEPFGIIAYGTFSLLLLGFRQRGLAVREELARARAERLALERLARVAIALRDLANTPVQILELVRQELLIVAPELRVHTDRMRRALAQLRRLNEVLLPYEPTVTWDRSGHAFEEELAPSQAKDEAGSEGAARSRGPPGPRHRA